MRRSGARLRVVVVLATLGLVASGCDWVQWGNDAGHAGAISPTGLTKASLAGRAPDNLLHAAVTGQVALSRGVVLVQQDGGLSAVDTTTRDVAWNATLPAGSTVGSVPAVDPGTGTVFVTVSGAANPAVYGFDLAGTRNCSAVARVCNAVFAANVGSASGPASPPVVAGGRVYVNGAGTLEAFDASGQTNCTTVFGARLCDPLWTQPTGFSAAGVGPALRDGTLYDVVASGGGLGLRAFDAATGTPTWTMPIGATPGAGPSVAPDGTVAVPSGVAIFTFAPGGTARAVLLEAGGDPAGDFRGGVVFDGANAYATNANGRVYRWDLSTCAALCAPMFDVAVNTPSGGSSTYSQTPAVASGMLILLAQRPVAGTNHVFAVARDDVTGAELASWDLLAPGFGAGLSSPSVTTAGTILAPVDQAVFSIGAAPAGGPLARMTTYPLPLAPGFSPGVHDYVVRCSAGTNTVTLGLGAVGGGGTVGLTQPTSTTPSASQNVTVPLAESQAAVVRATGGGAANVDYWVRCLPHDFPGLRVVTHPLAGAPTPGWYLTGNVTVGSGDSSYAMILDTNGTPVWYEKGSAPVSNTTSIAVNAVAYDPAIASNGFGIDPNGAFRIDHLDTGQVQLARTVGVPTDFHEFQVLPNGDYVMLSFPIKTGVDLTGLHGFGPNSNVADCVVQEVSPQGQLVYQWTGSDHIDPVRESWHPNVVTINGQTVIDPYHCNSVDVDANGNLLISARHMDSVFFVNRTTGKIVWKMGGPAFNKDGAEYYSVVSEPQGPFSGQHDARFLPNGDVALFDDHTYSAGNARGVEYALDKATHTARAVFQYVAPGFNAIATGSFRRLPDGHSVIGWGIGASTRVNHLLTEIDAAGRDVLDVDFGPGNSSYRVLKAPASAYDVDVLHAAVH